ncbi:MAG: phosphate ABC transporter permease subunit PstC [Thermoplasmatota archaeon]
MDRRHLRDFIGTKLMLSVTAIISVLFFVIFFILLFRSLALFEATSLPELLFSTLWNPEKGSFGLSAILIGTILVTGLSLIIAIPISLLCAIYISEYSHEKIRRILRPFLDVLAGVPSVVYGLCAFIVIVPLTRDVFSPLFGVSSTGLCVFSASLVLAVMVFPIIISLCVETFSAIPIELKEASLSVGATRWETVKKVIFRASTPSIISAVLLGFGRAFGETIAVNMVIGGLPKIPATLFSPAQTLASLIASAYGELMSVPLYESALMFVALLLFVVVVIFNILGVLVLKRSKRRFK